MATTKKALALADELASELKQRQTALAVAQSFDTDGNPLIQVGAGTAGAKGGLVKIKPIDWPLAKDILGLQAEVYTPHVIQLGVEANPAGGAGADVNDRVTELLLLATLVTRGTRVEVYETASGTAPAANATNTFAAGNFKAAYDASVQFPMISSQ
jgi:hypothetical protein